MTIISFIGYILLIVFALYMARENFLNYLWEKEPLKNFPFKWRGKKYWYSRSCAVVLFTFCKDKDDNVYVLANKRGEGTPDFSGCWNAPCGYLDYNEDGKEAAIRETKEETGVEIPYEGIKLIEVASSPKQNRQNVTLRYGVMLDGTIDKYAKQFSKKYMEENEVDDIKWIHVDGEDMNTYEWAFGHHDIIKSIYNKMCDGAVDCSVQE